MLSLLLACAAGPDPSDPKSGREVTVSLSAAMPTVAHVVWTSPAPSIGRVTGAGFADTPQEATPTTAHDVRVTGLHALSDYDLEVVEDDVVVAAATISTGELDPANGRPLGVRSPLAGLGSVDHILFSAVDFGDAGRLGRFSTGTVSIVDRDGVAVWGVAMGDRFPMFPVWVPGVGVRALSTDFNDYGNSTLDTWDLDGNLASVPLPGAHHDVAWHADGTFAYTLTESRDIDGELVAADILVEVAPDGTSTRVWDAFVSLPGAITNNGGTNLADGAIDWTHANGISWLPDEDAYLLSLFGPHQIVRIDRATGTTTWVLGGDTGEFALASGAAFGAQHCPLATAGGVMLFDNAASSSRLLALAVDEAGRTASLAWEWESPDPPGWTPLGGFIEPVADEGMLVSWGLVPALYALDADRQLVGEFRQDDPVFVGSLGAVRGVAGLY